MGKRKQKNINTHKRQAWGTLVLAVGILLFFAIVSFDVNDPINLDSGANRIQITNWLGLFGASISYYLMQWTLGYPILVLPLILFLYALQAIKNQTFARFRRPSVHLIVWSVMLSIYLAMPEAIEKLGEVTEYYPSGLIGGWLASKLVIFLGKFGSIATLVLLSMVLIVISIRIELHRFVTALGNVRRGMFAGLVNKLDRFNEQRKLKREEKQQVRLEAEIKKQKELEEKKKLHVPELKTNEEPQRPAIHIEETKPEPESLEIPEPEVSIEDKQLEETAEPVKQDGMIQTTLEELLDTMDKKQQQPQEQSKAPAGNGMDFEVKEAIKDQELDYDDLVKESMAKYRFPSIDELADSKPNDNPVSREELKSNAELLEMKLNDYGVDAKVVRVSAGPVITLYELQPARGVKVSAIVNLANDLALAMEARGIRIIAPIPGKAAVGIEIPNRNPQMVFLKSLIRSEKFNKAGYELPLAIGKTINGESYIADLTKMPHMLIAGATGAGKSVGINTIIMSLLYAVNPGKVKFMMIDPKKLELSIYRPLKDHYLLWRPDLDEEVVTKPNNAVSMLNSLVLEMEKRYNLLADLAVRNIVDYNKRIADGGKKVKDNKLQQLPYIVIIIDELADLMMVAAKEIEAPIARLAQMARAVGLHLIVATQRPSVDVITGVIKANFPARIAYLVATKVDSRTILDINGAEQLLGNGDMLFLPPGFPKPIRLQNPFVSTDEVESVIGHIRRQPKLPYYSIPQPKSAKQAGLDFGTSDGHDPLYEDARAIVVQHQQGSISFLQRRLKVGYSRAARLMDELEEEGIVGPADGSKPRDVLISLQELDQMK